MFTNTKKQYDDLLGEFYFIDFHSAFCDVDVEIDCLPFNNGFANTNDHRERCKL